LETDVGCVRVQLLSTFSVSVNSPDDGVSYEAGGIEIGPIFKRGPSKVNSLTLNKTIIKPKIILTLKSAL
jgi:hypothetical protein